MNIIKSDYGPLNHTYHLQVVQEFIVFIVMICLVNAACQIASSRQMACLLHTVRCGSVGKMRAVTV